MCLKCGGLRYPDNPPNTNQDSGPPDSQSLSHYPNIQNTNRGNMNQYLQNNGSYSRGSGARGVRGRGNNVAGPVMANPHYQRGYNHRGTGIRGRGRGITVAPQDIDFQGEVLARLDDQSEKLDRIAQM